MRTKRFARNVSRYIIGKNINYLEIGVFRGSTIKWVSEVTGPEAKCIGVDPWEFSIASRRIYPDDMNGNAKWANMINNLRKMQHSSRGKIKLIKGYSQDVLPYQFKDKKGFFDFIYVDGHHTIHAVMRDFCLAWPLLKIGGVMCFDDYKMVHSNEVQEAVDLIVKGFMPRKKTMFKRNAKIEILFKNTQYGIRKLAE